MLVELRSCYRGSRILKVENIYCFFFYRESFLGIGLRICEWIEMVLRGIEKLFIVMVGLEIEMLSE